MVSQPSLPLLSMRWHHGHTRYRPSRETINPAHYTVELIDESTAKAYTCREHYSHRYPPARLRVGLFHKTASTPERLVGACVFSVPIQPAAIPAYSQQPSRSGIELGRLVLSEDVPGNGESFFIARALRLLHQALPEIRVLIGYSDPVPRIINGETVKRGHVGCCYAAAGFTFCGRAHPRTLVIARRNGQVLSERSLSKLRHGERGRDYVLRQLRDLGAPPLGLHERPDAYLAWVLEDTSLFLRFRHPGNYVYLAPVGPRADRRCFRLAHPQVRPYPKQPDPPLHP